MSHQDLTQDLMNRVPLVLVQVPVLIIEMEVLMVPLRLKFPSLQDLTRDLMILRDLVP